MTWPAACVSAPDMWFLPRPPLPPDASLAERFARFADEVVLGLGARWHADRMSGVAFISVQLLELVGIRLQKLRKRFLALIARAQAGPLPPPRPPRVRKGESRQRQRPFPEPFGWLLKLGTWRVAPCQRDLERLLAHPEMQELLRKAPQAGRLLRPMFWMLALKPDPALLPPPPKRVRRTAPVPTEPDPAAPLHRPREPAPKSRCASVRCAPSRISASRSGPSPARSGASGAASGCWSRSENRPDWAACPRTPILLRYQYVSLDRSPRQPRVGRRNGRRPPWAPHAISPTPSEPGGQHARGEAVSVPLASSTRRPDRGETVSPDYASPRTTEISKSRIFLRSVLRFSPSMEAALIWLPRVADNTSWISGRSISANTSP